MQIRPILFKIIFCLISTFFVAVLSYAIPMWFVVLSEKYETAGLTTRIYSLFQLKTALLPALLALIFSIWASLQWEEQLLVKLTRFFLILGMVISAITYISLKSIL